MHLAIELAPVWDPGTSLLCTYIPIYIHTSRAVDDLTLLHFQGLY
jgi:hypothetical protein